jgi:hypothetical protein
VILLLVTGLPAPLASRLTSQLVNSAKLLLRVGVWSRTAEFPLVMDSLLASPLVYRAVPSVVVSILK